MILCKSLQHGRKCDHIVVWLQASSSADVFEDSQFEIEALANSVVFLAVRIHLCHHGRFLAVQCCSSSRVWLLGRLLKVVLRSEEHTSELQSRVDLVCRLLLEK